jgi:hypothetical protein
MNLMERSHGASRVLYLCVKCRAEHPTPEDAETCYDSHTANEIDESIFLLRADVGRMVDALAGVKILTGSDRAIHDAHLRLANSILEKIKIHFRARGLG